MWAGVINQKHIFMSYFDKYEIIQELGEGSFGKYQVEI
jgi:hypothetical protein